MAKEIGVDKFSGFVGGLFGGLDSGFSGMFSNMGKFALIGAGIFTAIGTPFTLAAVSYATFKVGKSLYKKAKKRPKLKEADEEYDLFT